MKKQLPYLLLVVLAAAVIGLFITGNNKRKKDIDQRVTMKRQDKIPYGAYIAYKSLSHIFPNAKIIVNRDEPGYWDSLSMNESGQALIIITGNFNADESEMRKLVAFMEKGNDVFVSARTISYSARDMIDCKVQTSGFSMYGEEDRDNADDSLVVSLLEPPFTEEQKFRYPGKRLDAYFFDLDENMVEVLGEDGAGKPNFIRMRAGRGNFYMHLAPLALSNYFLLHKNNIAYYEKAMSVMGKNTMKVAWDEYFLTKRYTRPPQEKQGWFSVLSRYPGLKAALLTAIFTLLAYVLLEMRRKQRYIPVVTKPRNDSLDFVKTIGRLYFDRGDHRNLARKMGAYFLEHVRSKYKLATGTLDDNFVKNLQYKSGAGEQELRGIIYFIKYAEDAPAITPAELADFHRQLEIFYQKA